MEAVSARFRALQASLRERARAFAADPRAPYTAVIVPSQSVDPEELAKIPGVGHYEERALFNLMLLRHPRLKVVFVTSKRLDPLIVDYYLHQMRSVPGAHARRRLVLLDCDDASPRPLTTKILERPMLLRRIREAIGDPTRAHMNVFNATALERELAVALDIPLNACDPELTHLGSKTGSRTLFEAAGVPCSPGHHGLRDVDDLAQALAELWAGRPDLRRVVVKLNDSFSGEGNAVLDLSALPTPAAPADRARIVREALPALRFEAEGLVWERYAAQFDRMGGIVEAWLEGDDKRSPSAQLRISPLGDVQPVSTHDQVLGGPSGQVFLGATFPARPQDRLRVQEAAVRVGEQLAERGVIGRFAVDFIATGQELYALEINLRQGGTTHPFNTVKFITDGRYNAESGTFHTAAGHERSYFATDTLSHARYRGILPFDLIDALVYEGLHFSADECGTVFHLMGCLSEHGKLGCTSVAESVPDALQMHERVVRVLDALANER